MRHLVCNCCQSAGVPRIVLSRSLPLSKLFLVPFPPVSSAPMTSPVQHRPPPRSSSRILSLFLSFSAFCFGLTAFAKFLHILAHAGRLKRGVLSFVFGSSNFTVFADLGPASASNCTTNTPFLLHVGILWPVLMFSMYDSYGPNTTMLHSSTISPTEADGLLTSASKNLMLHCLPSRTNSSLASPSTRIGLPLAAAILTVFVAFVLAAPFFRTGHTLLASPESTVHHLLQCDVASLLQARSYTLPKRPKLQQQKTWKKTKRKRNLCRQPFGKKKEQNEKSGHNML